MAVNSEIFIDKSEIYYSIDRFYRKTKIQLVIVIDEWDAVFREHKDDREGQKKYLDFLRDWLKDKEYNALAYITGILPIKKYGKHSALNMFDEYSMTQPMRLASYTGFTVDEVRDLCDQYEMDYTEISGWYDGYIVSDYIPVNKRKLYRLGEYEEHRIRIYSPLSVVNAMRSGEIENYWNETENYEALQRYVTLVPQTVTKMLQKYYDYNIVKVRESFLSRSVFESVVCYFDHRMGSWRRGGSDSERFYALIASTIV